MVGAATPPQAQGEWEGVPAHLGAAYNPGASATTFALEDEAEASLLGVWANFKGSGMSAVSSLLLPQQACSVMCPVGISFIIFPLHLINPHPVMNLEISIKHIITNQRRAGGSWRLLTAGCAVRLWAWTPAPPVGLTRSPGAPSLPSNVRKGPSRSLGVCRPGRDAQWSVLLWTGSEDYAVGGGGGVGMGVAGPSS